MQILLEFLGTTAVANMTSGNLVMIVIGAIISKSDGDKMRMKLKTICTAMAADRANTAFEEINKNTSKKSIKKKNGISFFKPHFKK